MTNVGEKDPHTVSALKAAYEAMSDVIKTRFPDTVPLYAREAEAITARNMLNKKLASSHLLINSIEALAGVGVGLNSDGDFKTRLQNGFGTFLGLKALESTPARTALAVGVDKVGKQLLKPGRIAQGAKAIGKLLQRNTTAQAVQ